MQVKLRPYQKEAKLKIADAFQAGTRNVLAVLPTGSGKTVVFSDVLREHSGASCAIAHRQELVSQISVALARDGVRHRIIGPKNIVKLCVSLHVAELGVSFYDPAARCAVAGIDTLVRREAELGPWLNSVTLWVQDEAHHVLEANKWGTGAKMLPNARGLGVTATPLRADGKGLGRHADGLFDELIVGPGMRELINAGYLTDYRIFAPPSNFVRPDGIGGSGDFTRQKMTAAVRGSQVVGDIVDHYQRIAPGKLGVTFVPDVETAKEVARKFNEAGVPAEVVSAKTPDADRLAILRRFKRRELLQLVNVDLFGEGFDLPAIEVVSMGRPTESFGLYVQQFGRVLRLMLDASLYATWDDITAEQRRAHIAASSKPRGIIIDHVGNVTRHGLPDARREWTLDAREKRRKKDGPTIPVWTCLECLGVWERIYNVCQDCGAPMPAPSSRAGPQFVDGDLLELDAETLAGLRGDVDEVDKDPEIYREELAAKHTPHIGQLAHVKRHSERQAAQQVLRESIALWGGIQRAAGRPDSESYRRFFFAFGVDVLSAQALNTKEALELNDRIRAEIGAPEVTRPKFEDRTDEEIALDALISSGRTVVAKSEIWAGRGPTSTSIAFKRAGWRAACRFILHRESTTLYARDDITEDEAREIYLNECGIKTDEDIALDALISSGRTVVASWEINAGNKARVTSAFGRAEWRAHGVTRISSLRARLYSRDDITKDEARKIYLEEMAENEKIR